MDEQTCNYYTTHAAEIAARYAAATSSLSRYLPLAFAAGMRVLDIGAGAGRDLDALLALGIDGFGVEPCAGLRQYATAHYPALSGRIAEGSLPNLGQPFGGQFDGVLCSAVLMHLPRERLFDAAFAIRGVLKDGGRLLLSVPAARPGLDAAHRDEHGRLFTPLPADFLVLLFERLGFQTIGRWTSEDGMGRPGHSWHVLLFTLRHAATLRPLDQIEGILNRDRKTATYKLALFRALSEIATTEYEQARWLEGGQVGLPVDVVTEKWLHYYWPLFESSRFIPQIRGEAPACRMPVAFRAQLAALIDLYRGNGGLTAFVMDYRSRNLSEPAQVALRNVMEKIRNTIVKGPVTYAGGSLELGRVFDYDRRRREITMSASLWRELSLMGHWIRDAVIVRWAELTADISNGEIRPSEVIDLLLTTPVAERDVAAARQTFAAMPDKECAWSGKPLPGAFDVDHVIPFSLWHNNDLWNLLPALPAVNNQKRDRLPTRSLLLRRKDYIVHCWQVLRAAYEHRFQHEACRVVGLEKLPSDWVGLTFEKVAEAIEVTAIQRGVERWEP